MSICIGFNFWWQFCDKHINGTDYGGDGCRAFSRPGISEPLHEELQIVGALAGWNKQQAIAILAHNKAVYDVRRTFMLWL